MPFKAMETGFRNTAQDGAEPATIPAGLGGSAIARQEEQE
jgi:hypothetical protein